MIAYSLQPQLSEIQNMASYFRLNIMFNNFKHTHTHLPNANIMAKVSFVMIAHLAYPPPLSFSLSLPPPAWANFTNYI